MSVGDERLVDDVRVGNVAAGVPGLHKVIWDVVRFTVLQLRAEVATWTFSDVIGTCRGLSWADLDVICKFVRKRETSHIKSLQLGAPSCTRHHDKFT